MCLVGCALDAPATGEQVDATTVCGNGQTVKGVDVSYYQGAIDWNAVKSDGVEFAIVRVSDGIGFEDPQFDANWTGTHAAGIYRGAYQFFRPNQDAIAQADLLLSRMGPLGPDDLPPVIDVEADGGLPPAAVASAVRTWIDHVTAAIGRAPIIYTGFFFWRDQVGAADMTTSPLWHAQYTTAECPNIAPPWPDWAFWQFTSSGRVAGISGDVDTNRFNGSHQQLLDFIAPRACGTIPAEGGTIDDTDACFFGGGPPAALRHVQGAGEGGGLVWTYTTVQPEENFGQWNLSLAEAGRYQIEVSTPAAFAHSRQAKYIVHTAAGDTPVMIDQTAVDGFQSLGEFDLAQGGDQFIHVGDSTGEPYTDQVQIAFDAVRLTRVTPGGGDPGSGGGGSGDDEPGEPGGCTTSHSSTASSSTALGVLLVVLGLSWRRRCKPTRRSGRDRPRRTDLD